MNRRSFLTLGGSFAAWTIMPSLPLSGNAVYTIKPLDLNWLLYKLEYRPITAPIPLSIRPGRMRRSQPLGAWVTPILDVQLRPGHASPWFHREGPFGLYQSVYNENRRDESRLYLERMVRAWVRHYDERRPA